MSWGKRVPRSHSPIVVGDTPAALASARSEGSSSSESALKSRSASARSKYSLVRLDGPLSLMTRPALSTLSSCPLDNQQRKTATHCHQRQHGRDVQPGAEARRTPTWTASINSSARRIRCRAAKEHLMESRPTQFRS